MIPVIFRKWPESKGGGIIALFPTLLGTNDPYTCESYEHVGQHGAADPSGVMRSTKTATPAEYRDLMRELRGIGYKNMRVFSRLQPSFLEDRKRALRGERPIVREIQKIVRKKKLHKSNGQLSLGSMR